MKNVIIIGGGIIGLSVAYYLQKEGYQVTITDRSDITGGASFANAGCITPSHIIPLAAPGTVAKGLKMIFNPSSPFCIKPQFSIDFLRWLWYFNKSSNAAHVAKSVSIIKAINMLSRALYEEISALGEMKFSYDRKGLLMCYKTDAGGEKEAEIAHIAKTEGLDVKHMSPDELKVLEPDAGLKVRGAVYYKCDAHMIPGEYMRELYKHLKSKGVHFYTNEAVTDIVVNRQKVSKVITAKRVLEADEVVVAAGVWSSFISKKMGIKTLIQPGKGYCIDVKRPTGITIPAILTEAKVAVTPMDGMTRFAGTMELGGMLHSVNKLKVQAIADAASDYYDRVWVQKSETANADCGLRPITPDGLPYIGRVSRYKNVIMACGHAMMGWSLGPATGKLVTEIISKSKTSIDITAFHPDRKF